MNDAITWKVWAALFITSTLMLAGGGWALSAATGLPVTHAPLDDWSGFVALYVASWVAAGVIEVHP